MELPKVALMPTSSDPSFLVLGGHSNEGKSTLIQGLPNALHLFFESRSGHIGGKKMELPSLVGKKIRRMVNGKPEDKVIPDIYAAYLYTKNLLRKAREAGELYDHLVIDSTSSFEEMVNRSAIAAFQKSPVAKGMLKKAIAEKEVPSTSTVYPLTHITEMNQLGWQYYFDAYKRELEELFTFARVGLILIAHTKQASLDKNEEKLSVEKDLDIPGKTGRFIIHSADGAAIVRREENKTIVSFKQTSATARAAKGGIPHLNEQEFVLSELLNFEAVQKDPTIPMDFKYSWELIYPNYFKSLKQ
jgi:hypothetical protein